MPTELASETAIYDAEQQERKANWPTYLADVVASQQGPSNIPSSSENRLGEGTAVGNNGNNSEERSRFSEVWKGVKFSRDKATELVGQEPTCGRCQKLLLPCTSLAGKLTCLECQTAKVVCPRKLINIIRVLTHKLGESEGEVRSKYYRFMAPSRQKGQEGDDEFAKGKGKKSETKGEAGKAKGKGKKKAGLPKIIIPGGRGNKLNETQPERSNSRASRDDDEMEKDELGIDVDVPGTSKPQPQHSDSRGPLVTIDTTGGVPTHQSRRSDSPGPDANDNQKVNEEIPASKIAVEISEPAKPQPPQSPLQMPQVDDTQPANENSLEMQVDRPAVPSPRFLRSRSQIQDIQLHLKQLHKTWDDLSRLELYDRMDGYETRQILSCQLLDDVTSTKDELADHVLNFGDLLKDCQMRIKDLENGDDLLANLTREWTDATNLLEETRSEVQQAVNQRLEAESQLSDLRMKMEEVRSEVRELDCQAESEMYQLRRKVEELQGEKEDALKECHRLRDLLQGARGTSELSPAQDQEHDDEAFDPPQHSFGTQPSAQSENPRDIAAITNALAVRTRMLEQEKNWREELESEVTALRSALGKVNLHEHLLSEYGAFAREVQTTALALQGIEASVIRETDFPCKDFHAMNQNLAAASTAANWRIGIMKRGKFQIVGFTEVSYDSDSDGHRSPTPGQEKRGQKRKDREYDVEESRTRSWRSD